METLTKDRIQQQLVAILEDMTAEWDLGLAGPIGPDTKLIADLGFESIDVVQLVVAIEEQFQRRGLPFEEFFMVGGRYVDEIRVSDCVDFLHRNLHD
jgi:acyl carrier protein